MSALTLPSRTTDVSLSKAPQHLTLNSALRQERSFNFSFNSGVDSRRRPNASVLQSTQIKNLPIRSNNQSTRIPQLVPAMPEVKIPDNITAKSSPDFWHSMRRQKDVRNISASGSVATVRFDPAHGQSEFRPFSFVDFNSPSSMPAVRTRTTSNPAPAQRRTSTSSSASGAAWCSTHNEIPNFSRKLAVKHTPTNSVSSQPGDSSMNSHSSSIYASPPPEYSPPRTYNPATSSPLSRPKSITSIQTSRSETSQRSTSRPNLHSSHRTISGTSLRAEDEWRCSASVPAFSRSALKNSTIIMPLKATDLASKEKERNLNRLKRGSKSNVDLRSTAARHPRDSSGVGKSKLHADSDVIDISRSAPAERPSRRLRSSFISANPSQAKKRVRIVEEPVPPLPQTSMDSKFKGIFDRLEGSVDPSSGSPPRTDSMICAQKYSRRRSNSLPYALRGTAIPKISPEWLDSSSDELRRFLNPSPTPAAISPGRMPPPVESTVPQISKASSLPNYSTPLLRLSESGNDNKVEVNGPRISPLPKLDFEGTSRGEGQLFEPRLPSPAFGSMPVERTDSNFTTSSSSSNETYYTDRSEGTIASSKTSVESQGSILKPLAAAKARERSIQLPPPPESSADLWREGGGEAEFQHPTFEIKPDKWPGFMAKLVNGLGLRKTSESKRIRCNCGITTVNLHYKKYHTSNAAGTL